jgi:uncharacterized protein YndB with AHSA1/START domain
MAGTKEFKIKGNNQMEETKHETKVERISDLELVVSRTVNAPAHLVFEAWTNPDLFRRWWVPKSYGLNLVSCDMDVRVGGEYRLAFLHEGSTMEFFGTYLEVTPNSRIVWTNDEGDAGQTVTTVTFEENEGKTLLKVHDRYPTKESVHNGATGAMPEVLEQLEELLSSLG